jgi:hypothetical protein
LEGAVSSAAVGAGCLKCITTYIKQYNLHEADAVQYKLGNWQALLEKNKDGKPFWHEPAGQWREAGMTLGVLHCSLFGLCGD